MSETPGQHKKISSNLDLNIHGDGQKYKSISDVEWNGIPPFAILTGINGSGKTQFLDLLAYLLTKERPLSSSASFPNSRIEILGDAFKPEEVVYIPAQYSPQSRNVSSVNQLKTETENLLGALSGRIGLGSEVPLRLLRSRLEKHFNTSTFQQMSQEDFFQKLPKDYAFMLHNVDTVSNLAHVFMAYRIQRAETLEKNLNQRTFLELTTPPWEVVNQALEVAAFSYRIMSPETVPLLSNYNLTLSDTSTGATVSPQDLSSGEKVILQLILWLYNSNSYNQFPKLLLLDEPDAHLHPSMTQQFMDVINEVLVKRHKVRVIMTTHSPSTVALAPEGSVFEMPRTDPRIIITKSKEEIIGKLTAGMVIVSRTTRYVFVEDEEDVGFYDAVRDILTDYGPRKDDFALNSSSSLIFLPVCVGKSRDKVSGGKGVVAAWVNKLDAAPLNHLFRGVIDMDDGNESQARIEVLKRYSFENYLLDPILIFAVLLNEGLASSFTFIKISQGNEHLIRELPEEQLQKIVDVMEDSLSSIYHDLPYSPRERTKVTYTNGITLVYPPWMIFYRGHDLLPKFQAVFQCPRIIHLPKLLQMLRRVRMIPSELATILTRLQTDHSV